MESPEVCGVVAEFNPFHNGHRALLAFAREAGARAVVAVMSGHFVQRGSLAVTTKWVRAAAALRCGADLVIELPLPYAAATARRFAGGAVGLLKAAGVVDTLLFGSECGEAEPLRELAGRIEATEVREAMQPLLGQGMTFARARQQAVEEVCGPRAAHLLSSPNNALAVEYLYEAARQGWRPQVLTMPRRGAAHDAREPGGRYASASFLREHAGDTAVLRRYVPAAALRQYGAARRAGLYPADPRRLEGAVLAQLRRLAPAQLADLPDLSEGLENRLYSAVRKAGSLAELEMLMKTKRYTLARVRRLILGAFLGLTRPDADAPPSYLRVLGFSRRGRELLPLLKGAACLPVDTSLARLERLGESCARAAYLEALSSDLYALALPQPPPCGWEYTTPGVYLGR